MNKDVLELLKSAELLVKLERFTPRKPEIHDGYTYDDEGNLLYDTYDCPNCGTNYEFDYDGKHKFCPECGQALDWREVETVKPTEE